MRGVCFPLQMPRCDTHLAQFFLNDIEHSGFAGWYNHLELPCLFSLSIPVGALPLPPLPATSPARPSALLRFCSRRRCSLRTNSAGKTGGRDCSSAVLFTP